MPHQQRRKTLEGLFEGLPIPKVSSPCSSSKHDFVKAIKGTMKAHWPHWGSIRGKAEFAHFTIKMNDNYRWYNLHAEEGPEDHFEQIMKDFEIVQKTISQMSASEEQILEETIVDDMTTVIFGSNLIERVGTDLDETIKICEKVFRGEDVDSPPRSPEYQQRLEERTSAAHSEDQRVVCRQRIEVIHHARALKHIVTAMVLNNEQLSESLILETHRILCDGLPLDDGKEQIAYAGRYREVPVSAGIHSFPDPSLVPFLMKGMVQDFATEIRDAEREGSLDPYFMAAKYCHKLVNIHPFVDGNGRICRLVMNAILLKYAGIVVPLGEKDNLRSEYLNIAANASAAHEEDETPWAELGTLVIATARAKLREWKERFSYT